VLCPGVIRTPILEGGRHGIFLAAGSEEAQRNLAREFFEQFRPMPPETFAQKALDRIARNQAIIIVPAWWRVFWWMERAAPSLWAFLGRKGYGAARARLSRDSRSTERVTSILGGRVVRIAVQPALPGLRRGDHGMPGRPRVLRGVPVR
jgi:hypothetical protein